VILFGTTDAADGKVVAVMRYLSLDQPFTGKLRKSSGSPLYKEGMISGTIENADFEATVYLVDDE